MKTAAGIKTRSFDHFLLKLERTVDAPQAAGTRLNDQQSLELAFLLAGAMGR